MSSERTKYLIENLQEGLDVEVKNWLGGLEENEYKARLAKEIIALANNGGGQIFIGFNDDVNHSEIEPAENELDGFSQDNISSLVNRYIDPPCQCNVGYFSRNGSDISHPVITVPSKHRTPVWAKRASPDNRTLQTGVVYIRRPGGGSEPCRNQDDWEQLLDRLVKARQEDQLNAFRAILNPTSKIDTSSKTVLEIWKEESHGVWQDLIGALPEDSPHRLKAGYFTFSFHIESFSVDSLSILNQTLDREITSYSGWPLFTYLRNDDQKPKAKGDVIQAWLADTESGNAYLSDFWRVSKNGSGFLLRPMQEDETNYLSTRTPKPDGPLFDWIFPIYRVTELLKYVEALALKFSNENAIINVSINYYGTSGRSLECHDWKYNIWQKAKCDEQEIETNLSIVTHEIGTNIEERVYALLKPVFEQFEFSELPKLLVDNVVKEVMDFRR